MGWVGWVWLDASHPRWNFWGEQERPHPRLCHRDPLQLPLPLTSGKGEQKGFVFPRSEVLVNYGGKAAAGAEPKSWEAACEISVDLTGFGGDAGMVFLPFFQSRSLLSFPS